MTGILNNNVGLFEGQHRGEFIVSEANNYRSRDLAQIVNAGTTTLTFPAGLVLGTTAPASGATPQTVGAFLNTGTIGLQTASCVLYDNVIVGPSTTLKVTVVSRDAELNAAELKYDATVNNAGVIAAKTQLAAQHIILR